MNQLIHKFRKNQFLFEELVIRDFKQKYKRTVLGMAWSILSPLLTLRTCESESFSVKDLL